MNLRPSPFSVACMLLQPFCIFSEISILKKTKEIVLLRSGYDKYQQKESKVERDQSIVRLKLRIEQQREQLADWISKILFIAEGVAFEDVTLLASDPVTILESVSIDQNYRLALDQLREMAEVFGEGPEQEYFESAVTVMERRMNPEVVS